MTAQALPRAIVFDVGGVLVHLDPEAMASSVGAAVGVSLDPHACAISLQLASNDAYALGVPDSDPRVVTRWADRLGIARESAGRAWQAWQDADLDLWTRVDADAVALLRDLASRRLRLAIVSNANGDLDPTLRRLGLREPFELVVDSGVVGVAKPDPRAFELVVTGLGLAPDECWYVGDSLLELDAAVACGFARGVFCTVAGAAAAPPTDHAVIDRPRDLTVLLDALRGGV